MTYKLKHVMSLPEVKQRELDILLYVKKICDDNGLNYYLHGGTLIGALRHQGFIPWDDDIDICMPRMDYEKFLKLNKHKENQYISLNAESVNNYYYAFSKITDRQTATRDNNEKTEYGVFIDIFPIDNVPQGHFKKSIYFSRAYAYKRILMHLNEKETKKDRNVLKNILRQTVKLFNHKKIINHFNHYVTNIPNGSQVSTITTGSQWDISYQREWFADKVMVNFEGHEFPAPIGYDSLLHKYFGEYMIVPPKEKQITHGYIYVLTD
ncbi:LicD family protein [Leuconostoc carnosum]|nr:LicD family protein [Leuconostoc carnosum]